MNSPDPAQGRREPDTTQSGRILTPGTTRQELERINHRPVTKLGQNFLVDGNIVRKSLQMAEIGPDDRVVEIGPGLGTLTHALLETGATVQAIEFDRIHHQHLEASISPELASRLTLKQGDAVREPLAGLPDPEALPFKIVANLPYAISTPWLSGILEGPLPSRMVLMLQAETAARLTATHGSKDFGAISIVLQSAYRPAGKHRVSRNCFHPRPEVASALIRLDLRSDPIRLHLASKTLIRQFFRNRRKQIGSLLKAVPTALSTPFLARLETAGLSTQTRPEAIPLELWQDFDRLVRMAGSIDEE